MPARTRPHRARKAEPDNPSIFELVIGPGPNVEYTPDEWLAAFDWHRESLIARLIERRHGIWVLDQINGIDPGLRKASLAASQVETDERELESLQAHVDRLSVAERDCFTIRIAELERQIAAGRAEFDTLIAPFVN